MDEKEKNERAQKAFVGSVRQGDIEPYTGQISVTQL